MKSIIPLLVIPALAAFALVGCNQNTPVDSTDTQFTNSSTSAGITPGGSANAPATNNLPPVATNAPAGAKQ